MKKNIKALLFLICFTIVFAISSYAAELDLNSMSACLMEVSTGSVLYEKNADEKLEPASVTKIMSLILVFEAMDEGKFDLNTEVCASEHASSMGGSQIWLEPGETMTVNEMLKAVVVASANDCTVSLCELVSGSEESFVEKMNEKAALLGMTNTHFENCTGLPADNHYTTARDIAIMTRELYKHSAVFDYTKIWMDTLRGGEFGITNTNKLIRFYSGATGMKTGYTSSALYCMSATAQKGNMSLIASVMKSESSDKRFADAKKLLDFGFANYSLYTPVVPELPKVIVKGADIPVLEYDVLQNNILIEKGKESRITSSVEIPEYVKAPVKKNEKIGKVEYFLDGQKIAEFDAVAKNDVKRLTFGNLFARLFCKCITVR